MTTNAEVFLRQSVRMDLEIHPESRKLERVGALRQSDDGEKVFSKVKESRGKAPWKEWLSELDRFATGASFVLGHNLLRHDLPYLRETAPHLLLHHLPVIDTLFLSVLAFPRRPYHRLVKDYRLVRDSVNNPVADARLATELFSDCVEALKKQERETPGLLAFYAECFKGPELQDQGGVSDVLSRLAEAPREPRGADGLRDWLADKVCRFTLEQLIDGASGDAYPPDLAYAVAWLRVSGEDSILPPWVRLSFPRIPRLLDRLRRLSSAGDPCPMGSDCAFCAAQSSPEDELERYFGFPSFRDSPKTDDGASIQRQIAVRGLELRSQLAVLATGAGKSVCYQLPALVHFHRRGLLTLVISPLQALMKDQVENLNRRLGVERAAALNGLLTLPERGQVLERLRSGEIALLYVAPEQMRNRSFMRVVAGREIAGWVYDEAHCLSKWGHDFRPDYLAAAPFIKRLAELQQSEAPAVSCFTATAKRDVIAEILDHFQKELGIELELSAGNVDRQELRFFVEETPAPHKLPRIADLLRESLGIAAADASGPEQTAPGSAVIYFSSRRGTQEAARFLQHQGLDARAFHAGLSLPEKREVLDAFTQGQISIVCATNAFGMGIDKEDVRLVVHADIPGSLEAYLQEAGRAGRDRNPSDCVLLFNRDDVERQFRLSAASKLDKADIEEILRAVRRAARKRPDGVASLTTGEILRDEDLDANIRPDDWQADTQIRTAVAWLERAGFLERGHNRSWFFQGKLIAEDLKTANSRMDAKGITGAERRRWTSILRALFDSADDQGLTVDELALKIRVEDLDPKTRPGFQVIRDLQAMAGAGLIRQGMQLTAYLRAKGKGNAPLILEKVGHIERSMIETMREEDPDLEVGDSAHLSLRRLNQRLLDRGKPSDAEILRALLKSLSEDGKGLAESHGSLKLRYRRRGHYSVRLLRSWETLSELAERRRQAAQVALDALMAKAAGGSGQTLVAFSLDEIVDALQRDLVLRQTLRDPLAAAERALLFLHEHRAIQLQNGLAVFRQAMTLKPTDQKKGRRYSQRDFEPLAEHYIERAFQIHVMARYAEETMAKLRRGLELVQDYFEHGRDVFVTKWFHGREQDLFRATSPSSYRAVVDDLKNPRQQEIVAAPVDQNLLVLAGPGSGKTRVVVHRCAYLLKVERVPARSILMVCFNRAAALEMSRRLRALVGEEAYGVTVCTYHGLALRLIGRSLADGFDQGNLDRLIPDAVRLLETGSVEERPIEPAADDLRAGLLAGFRHILVDEYQDIDEPQYRMISALVGHSKAEGEKTLSIMAVGDDDQAIYGFSGANVELIRRFQTDYDAEVFHLVECYRCSPEIIRASNQLIAYNQDRMKRDKPIRIDYVRRHEPAGAPVRLYKLEPGPGSSENLQAATVIERILDLERVAEAENQKRGRIAVLARQHRFLDPVLALYNHHFPDRPVARLGRFPLPPLSRIREVFELADFLKRDRRAEVVPSEIVARVTKTPANRWQRMLVGILEDWVEQSLDLPCTADSILEFLFESLAEQRRDPTAGEDLVLATVHAAKGLELDHVFLLDGRWRHQRDPRKQEEERRLFYVGMTRARESLHLFSGVDGQNPHVTLLSDRVESKTTTAPPPDPAICGRRRSMIELKDVHLSWAGQQPEAVRRRIGELSCGDPLRLEKRRSGYFLIDAQGDAVARLSKAGAERWGPRIHGIEALHIYAWIERRAEDSDPTHRAGLVERWQVPMVEVTLKADVADF